MQINHGTQRFAARRLASIRTSLLLVACVVAGAAQATPEYLIVGDTQGGASHCQYATIQEALDAALANGPDLDYVFVTNTASYNGVALVVGDQSVLIEGGYDDCDLTLIGPRATIVGDQTHSVVDIQTGSDSGREITLRHLDLSLGDASFGGGIFIFGNSLAPPYVLIEDVLVHDNKATFGGGITSAFATLAIGKDVGVMDNTARRLGGGMFLQGGTVRIENDRTAVSGNHAQFDINQLPSGLGGGIYAVGLAGAPLDVSIGSWQYNVGDPRPPITGFAISNNRADDKGGGLYLNNGYVEVLAFETTLLGNSAANGGGGVYIYNGGTLQMSRDFPGAPPAPHCADYLQCNVIRNNSVDPHNNFVASGGGITLQVGTLRLNQTALLENTADSASAINTGSIGLPSAPNNVRLQGVLASRNNCVHTSNFRPCATIDLGAGAVARISYTTIADNVHLPGSSPTEIYAYATAASSLTLLSSIVFNASNLVGAVFSGGGATYQTDCVISSSNFLPAGSTRTQVAVPGFNKPAAYDYRLRSESLATDYCDNANTSLDDFNDLTLSARGFDDARHADLYGHFDVGAFESDHIFGGGYD